MIREDISIICKRAAALRKGRSLEELSPHDAFIQANKEYKEGLL
jgi:hypothetical protein